MKGPSRPLIPAATPPSDAFAKLLTIRSHRRRDDVRKVPSRKAPIGDQYLGLAISRPMCTGSLLPKLANRHFTGPDFFFIRSAPSNRDVVQPYISPTRCTGEAPSLKPRVKSL